VDHGNRIGTGQAQGGGLHGSQQVTFVEMVDQMGDDLGVGLAQEHIAFALQFMTQRLVVLDDAVVHQGHTPGLAGGHIGTRPMREMGMRVVNGRRPVRGPARVRNPQGAVDAFGLGVRPQFGHALGAA
jgi:hypothetical protein